MVISPTVDIKSGGGRAFTFGGGKALILVCCKHDAHKHASNNAFFVIENISDKN